MTQTKNLSLLLPTLTDADAQVWATVTALAPLRVKLDGDSAALPFTPDSLAGVLAVNDRVRVALSTNDDPAFRGCRVVVLGKPGGVHAAGDIDSGTFAIARIPTGTSGSTVALGNHSHTVMGENGIAGTAVSSGSDTRSNGTYANLAGTGSVTSFSFTKALTSTRIRIDMSATFFSSVSTSGARFGVLVDGVDYDVCQLRATVAVNEHVTAAGFVYIGASVVAAGSITVQGRWLRAEGGGTLTRDPADWLAISARELV